MLGDELWPTLPAGARVHVAPFVLRSQRPGGTRLLDFAKTRGHGHDAAPRARRRRLFRHPGRTTEGSADGRFRADAIPVELVRVRDRHDLYCRPAAGEHGLLTE